MRPDQIERLQKLTEDLADVFLTEAEPCNWPGHGEDMSTWTPQIRGDRHWTKKNAMGTGAVLKYTLDLAAGAGANGDEAGNLHGERDADLDRSIREAEQRAAQAVARVLNKAAGKEEFDKRAHGGR